MSGHVFVCRVDAGRLRCDARADPGPARGFLARVRRLFREAASAEPTAGRTRPLLAVPVPAGGPVADLLALARDAAGDQGFDCALVADDSPTFAALQAARRSTGESWTELGPLRTRAEALADEASRGELALFLGAGVSASAGLPLWGELLCRLAARAGVTAEEADELARLHPLDRAEIVERRLGGPAGLQAALRAEFASPEYGLQHALLAGLPVREAVTTNYDRLFETAREAAGGRPSVLPYSLRPDADGWVLKMHGCINHPEDIVLTRRQQVGYAERVAAVAGIVQTLLITRTVLFVGFSLTDDNFHRVAEAARRVVRPAAPPGSPRGRLGVALMLESGPLAEELWGGDVEWIGLSRPGDAPRDAARRLEVFLDCVLAHAHDVSHLLDDRFAGLLDASEAGLREALLDLAGRLPADHSGPARKKVDAMLRELGLPGA